MLLWLIENALLSVPLAALAWLACRGLRLSPAVRHGLWLVVLLKLVTPPLFAWPAFSPPARFVAWLTGESATTAAEAAPTTEPIVSPREQPRRTSMLEGSPSPDTVGGNHPIVGATPDAAHASELSVLVEYELFEVRRGGTAPRRAVEPLPSAPAAGQSPLVVAEPAALPATTPAVPTWRDHIAAMEEPLLALWLLGLAAMGVVQWRRIARFHRLLSTARPAPPALVAETERLAERMGVRVPPLWIVPGVYSPSIWALGRPKLLWPASLVEGHSLECLSGVLVHELAHLRRRDHWVGWLELAAACCWWWNPVYWLAARELRENAELACDAWVVMLLPDSRRAYARALIDVTQLVSTRPAPLPALGMAYGARRTFERRLTMILRDRVACQAPLWALLALGVLAVAVLPRWSSGQAPQEVPVDSATETGDSDAPALSEAPDEQVELPIIRAVEATSPPPLIQPEPAAVDPAGSSLPPTQNAAEGMTLTVVAEPAAGQDRLEVLEAQLQRLLNDVQALRAGRSGAGRQVTVQQFDPENGTLTTLDAESGRVMRVERLPRNYIAQGQVTLSTPPATVTAAPAAVPPAVSLQLGVNSDAGASGTVSGLLLSEPGVEVQTLSRAKYKLPPARAEALAQLLSSQIGGEVEVRVENELLVITTTPEAQQAIGAFIQFLSRFPAPETPAASYPAAVDYDALRYDALRATEPAGDPNAKGPAGEAQLPGNVPGVQQDPLPGATPAAAEPTVPRGQ